MARLTQRTSLLCLLLTLAAMPAIAQPSRGGDATPRLGLEVDFDTSRSDTLLIFSLGAEQLAERVNTVDVSVYAGRELLARERFSDVPALSVGQGQLNLEAFATHPDLRRNIQQAARAGSLLEVEVRINETSHLRWPYAELANVTTSALANGTLPTPHPSVTERAANVESGRGPLVRIPICGDGVCESTGFPAETCANCPQDCGPCFDCPTVIGTETRDQIIWASVGNLDCWLDHLQPNRQVQYREYRYLHRVETVELIEQCNGAITENVVSTTYYWSSCWSRTTTTCHGKKDWPPPCTL